MEWIGQFVLILLLKLVSPASVSKNITTPLPLITPLSPVTTTPKIEDLKTSSTYSVTENIIDIPDNRTLPPIVANFTAVRPLNLGNNTLLTNNVEDNNSKEKGDEHNNNHIDGELKNSFSILHIKGEYESNRPIHTQNHKNVFSKVIGDLKDYVYSLKRGVVDGLHSFFHRKDGDYKPVKESSFSYHQHRHFHDVEDFEGHSEYSDDDDDSSEEHYGHF